MPALVAIAYVFYNRATFSDIDWVTGAVALLDAMIFHCAGNLISDYHDFMHGVDSKDNIGQTNMTIIDGIMSPRTVLLYGFSFLAVGIMLGIWLTIQCGMPLLWMGIAGALLTVFYYRMKFTALGDIDIFIVFGILIALGTVFTMTGTIHPTALWASASCGMLIVAILHANNTRDRRTDSRAGIKTFAMILHLKGSKVYYTALVAVAYLLVVADIVAGILPPLSAMVVLSLPIATNNVRNMLHCKQMTEIAILDGESAKLVMIFSLLLSISCFVAPFI